LRLVAGPSGRAGTALTSVGALHSDPGRASQRRRQRRAPCANSLARQPRHVAQRIAVLA